MVHMIDYGTMSELKSNPRSKEIIYLLGMGTLLAASVIMPGLGIAAGSIVRVKRKYEWEQNQKEWQKFNIRFLRKNLRRLHHRKMVEVVIKDGQEILKLTDKGQAKYLTLKLEDLTLKSGNWDGKWRLVSYDISKMKRNHQDMFRRMLKQMNFLQLQKSVYLTPFKCKTEIEYLRNFLNLSNEVIYLEIAHLENEKYYKMYFGL